MSASFLAGLAGAQVASGPPSVVAPAEANLSPAQQFRLAEEYLREIAQAAEGVKSSLETARAARDVVKVLCINDKLTQIDVAFRSAEGRTQSLGQAVGANDVAKARHDFAVLQVLKDRVAALVAEASQCVGEEIGFVGESNVAVSVDPSIPDPDLERIGPDYVGIVLDSPVLSSPVL